jgi:orotidine-5'-phosphate decarboxylase
VGGGADFIREIRHRGGEIFLDLKFHDTPRNLLRAAIEATRLGVKMFDIHPYGCVETMARTRAEVSRICRSEGIRRPHILAVTMLAGLRTGGEPKLANGAGLDRVAQLARLAADAALDGVYTSTHEVSRVRTTCGRRFIIVTSGVRLRDGSDHTVHAIGAAEAIRAGVDYLVVGSPIWRASEPLQAVSEIAEDMEHGLRSSPRNPLELFSNRPV